MARPENDLSSHNTGSEEKDFLRSHANHVLTLLSYELGFDEKRYEKPSVLGRVVFGEAKGHACDRFTVVMDDSVTLEWDRMVKALWGLIL
jgi:hypothetical protein